MASEALVAILAGGRGRRLGGAKPTARLGRLALIEHALGAACKAGLDAVVVAKPDTRLPPLECEVVYESEREHHPLHGLLAALDCAARRAPQCACVVLACDMPFVTAPLLAWLAGDGTDAAATPLVAADALVIRAQGHLQPLLARYFPAHRPALAEALRNGRSLTAAAESLRPRIAGERELTRFGDPARLCFSVDCDADLQLARRLLTATPTSPR
jgi:molybdenum cofactor guanylyltransferase